MRNKEAVCDRTGKKILLKDGFFVGNPVNGEWSFVCSESPEHFADYNVPVFRITASPESLVDWIAHINEKPWFDSKKLVDFFTRFRDENDLFDAL